MENANLATWKSVYLGLNCLRSRSHQGKGHIKVKVIPRSNCKCLTFYRQVGGGPSTERHSS